MNINIELITKIHNNTDKTDQLNYDTYMIFCKFFELRFTELQHSSYIIEWYERFKDHNPISFMDLESQAAYKEALGFEVGI